MQLPQKWQARRVLDGNGERRLANVNNCPPSDFAARRQNLVAALERDRRQKLAVGEVFEAVAVAADADFALDGVVVRRDVLVVDRPVLSGAVVGLPLEVALAESQGDGVPQHRLSADAAAALGIKSRLARPHRWDLAIGKVEGEGVRVEVGARVDARAALDERNPDTAPRQVRRERPAGGAGTNNDDVECVGLHAKRGRLCVLIGAQSTATRPDERSMNSWYVGTAFRELTVRVKG